MACWIEKSEEVTGTREGARVTRVLSITTADECDVLSPFVEMGQLRGEETRVQ